MLDFDNLVESKTEQFYFLGGMIMCWAILYKFIAERVKIKGLKTKLLNDTINRIISIVHGIFTFIYACIHLYQQNPEFGSYNTPSQTFLLLASTAYFITDASACTFYGLADGGLYLHHSLAIGGYVSGILATYGATDGIYGIFYAEASNLPMHLRAIVKNLGFRYTRLYESLEITYIVIYAIARGIFTPIFLVLPCVQAENTPIMVKFICVGLFLQSVYFIREMMKILRRKDKQKRERRKAGVHYYWFSENPAIKDLDYVIKAQNQKNKIF